MDFFLYKLRMLKNFDVAASPEGQMFPYSIPKDS